MTGPVISDIRVNAAVAVTRSIREKLTGSGWDGARRLGIFDDLAELGVLLGEKTEATYNIKVFNEQLVLLNDNLVMNLDVDNLAAVPYSMMACTLGQIIDQGHEWGGKNERIAEALHELASAFIEGEDHMLVFSTPDNWTVKVKKLEDI